MSTKKYKLPVMDAEIIEAFCECSYGLHAYTSGTGLKRTKEFYINKELGQITALLPKLLIVEGDLYTVRSDEDGAYRVVTSGLGERFLSLCVCSGAEIQEFYPIHKFSPYTEVFFKYAHLAGNDSRLLKARYPDADSAKRISDQLNSVVESILEELRAESFKKSVTNAQRSAQKNFKSLNDYTNELRSRFSRLLVVRIDLGYAKHIDSKKDFGKDSIRKVKEHREALIDHVRRQYCGLVGYAWKLEFGVVKGFHYHVLIFLDGSMHMSDMIIAKSIGKFWVETVTENQGLYFNCNAKRKSYRFQAVGMHRYDDPEFIEGLRRSAIYMTKVDYYLRLGKRCAGRVFGKGELPKIDRKKPTGRPRAKSKIAQESVST